MAISRSAARAAVRSRPLSRTRPLSGRSRPAAIRSSVDLPQPEGPTYAMNSPARTCRSMPARMRLSPKDFSMACKCSAGVVDTAAIWWFSCSMEHLISGREFAAPAQFLGRRAPRAAKTGFRPYRLRTRALPRQGGARRRVLPDSRRTRKMKRDTTRS